jgi:hypothetical protein
VSEDRADDAEVDGVCGEGDEINGGMTQDEKWMARYSEVKSFIETNHRNPSKYAPEEKLMVHFMKRCRKLMNAGELKEPRLGMFKELLELSEQYKRKNQWE